MKFNSQICTTKEQSDRLLALGLEKGTADMYWSDHYGYTVPFPIGLKCIGTPAWSLHRLIEIAQLPNEWQCLSGDWYEEVIATIQSKIHIGELNKEYLEE